MAFVTDAAQRMQQMLADLLAYTHAGANARIPGRGLRGGAGAR